MSKRRLSRLGKQAQSNIGAWNSLAVKMGEMMLASAETIAQRSQGMTRMGTRPSAQDFREIHRMVQEKIEAAAESGHALWNEMIKLNTRLASLGWQQMAATNSAFLASLSGSTSRKRGKRQHHHAGRAALDVIEAATHIATAVSQSATKGLKPVHRRATANARRLRRRSR
jgi:hypothetical protein